jgi:KDO2-lipid IV(A) lauroyltransferase
VRALLISWLVRALAIPPLPVVRALGRAIGALLYRIPNRELRNARVNLALCFPELDPEQRETMLRRVLRENAISLLEMPGAWLSEPEVWLPRIETGTAVSDVREILAENRGLIVAAPHLGNWEVGIHFLSSIAPITVLYRPPREKRLEHVMVRGRSRNGARLVPTTPTGVRALQTALERGEMIAVLPDQQPKKAGAAAAFAPFFGVPALTMTLVSRLAAKSGAPVLFAFAARRPDGGYRAHWLLADPEIAAADPEVAAAALNRGVEHCVRLYPEQYQWTYRRFEIRPDGAPSPYL